MDGQPVPHGEPGRHAGLGPRACWLRTPLRPIQAKLRERSPQVGIDCCFEKLSFSSVPLRIQVNVSYQRIKLYWDKRTLILRLLNFVVSNTQDCKHKFPARALPRALT
jgi:hypothetical protein